MRERACKKGKGESSERLADNEMHYEMTYPLLSCVCVYVCDMHPVRLSWL